MPNLFVISLAFIFGLGADFAHACDDSALQQRDNEAWDTFFEERRLACAPALVALRRAHDLASTDYALIEPYQIKRLAVVYGDYEKSCLERLEDTRCETRAFITDALGGLFLPTGEHPNVPFCTITRIDDRHVLTARHCLYVDKRRMDESTFSVSLMSKPKKRFPVVGERFLEHVIDEAVSVVGYPFSDYEDIAVLEVNFEAAPEVARSVIGPNLVMGQETLVPGPFVPALFLETNLSSSSWSDKVRLDFSRNCQWLDAPPPIAKGADSSTKFPFFSSHLRKKRCIALECQTFKGMSGAPIIGYNKEDGRLFVGGIFIRSGSANSDTVRATCKSSELVGFNLGVTIPKDLTEALAR